MQRHLERRRSIAYCTVFFPQALDLPEKLDSFYSRCVFFWIPGALISCMSSRKFKVPTGGCRADISGSISLRQICQGQILLEYGAYRIVPTSRSRSFGNNGLLDTC